MKKRNPTGVRFNEEKLSFVMDREKLESPQQVVNFFLDSYWWQHKLNTGQIPSQVRMSPVVQNTPVIPPYDAYKLDLAEAASIDAIKKIAKAAEKDSELTGWQKNQIETLAVQLSQKLEF